MGKILNNNNNKMYDMTPLIDLKKGIVFSTALWKIHTHQEIHSLQCSKPYLRSKIWNVKRRPAIPCPSSEEYYIKKKNTKHSFFSQNTAVVYAEWT